MALATSHDVWIDLDVATTAWGIAVDMPAPNGWPVTAITVDGARDPANRID